ncbi:MAG: hypothetical protein WBD22_12430 [Pyrinomonadaceae bacterium]
MEPNRKPTQDEQKLLELLISKATNLHLSPRWRDDLLVRLMKDGEMGSFQLFPNGVVDENRLFGEMVSEYDFVDADGVKVIVSLNLDKAGELFEVDVWKTDFSPLIKMPDD